MTVGTGTPECLGGSTWSATDNACVCDEAGKVYDATAGTCSEAPVSQCTSPLLWDGFECVETLPTGEVTVLDDSSTHVRIALDYKQVVTLSETALATGQFSWTLPADAIESQSCFL